MASRRPAVSERSESKRRRSESKRPALSERSESKGPANLLLLGLAVALGLVTLAAYANSFQAELVMDSPVLIEQDPRVRANTPENIHNIFHQTYWWPAFESDLYRPVTTLTYLFNYAILDNSDRPAGYHVTNFLLHWMNACLVLVIVRRLAGRIELAVLAATLFALHPINTESVTNVAGRADLLATLSVLLGGWCYLRAAAARDWRRGAWLTALAANALWGVFAKESAVMICAFLPLYDWLWGKFGRGYVALVPALLTLWIVRSRIALASSALAQVFVDNPILGADGWFQARMTAIKVLGRYVALLAYPRTLSSDYSYNQIPLYGTQGAGLEDALSWISLAAIGLLLMISIRLRRRLPLFTWGVWFFFLMILPTSNLVMPIGSIMAERFLYLPSIGFCVVAAMALWWLGTAAARLTRASPSVQRIVAGSVCALVLGALGARTYARNADWRDERAIWQSTISAAPKSFKAYKGSATATWANGAGTGEQELDRAISLAERGMAVLDSPALPIERQDNTLFLDLGQYYRIKGEFLAKRGQVDDARPFFQKSVNVLVRARAVDRWTNEATRQRSLDHGQAARDIRDVGNFHVYVQLGAAYLDLYDWGESEAAARYAMHLQPLDTAAYRLAALARLNSGKTYDAAVLYVEIVTLQPHNADAWNELAICFERLGVQPAPIVRTSGTPVLDDRQAIARNMINEAAVALVRQLEDAAQFDAARTYEEDFVRRRGVPAASFRKLPKG